MYIVVEKPNIHSQEINVEHFIHGLIIFKVNFDFVIFITLLFTYNLF